MITLKTMYTHRKDVSEKRLLICEECEHFVKRTTKCEKCGCFMFAKTMFMNVECPIGKWKKEEEWQPQS
jgi:hypothetical protein